MSQAKYFKIMCRCLFHIVILYDRTVHSKTHRILSLYKTEHALKTIGFSYTEDVGVTRIKENIDVCQSIILFTPIHQIGNLKF